jgi:hypothetical protein
MASAIIYGAETPEMKNPVHQSAEVKPVSQIQLPPADF